MFYIKRDNEWCGNGQRFATKEESDASAAQRFMVWTMPSEWRSDESPDPVNYRHVNGNGRDERVKESDQ